MNRKTQIILEKKGKATKRLKPFYIRLNKEYGRIV